MNAPDTMETLTFADEQTVVTRLVDMLSDCADDEASVLEQASIWASQIRQHKSRAMLENFLKEYGLGTLEGVAVMGLAEALLRIPDPDTADLLIRDKLSHANWQQHLGKSHSLLVNASSWGLLLTGKYLQLGSDDSNTLLASAADRLGDPMLRRTLVAAMRFIGSQFVQGEDMEAAVARRDKVFRYSYDMLGEGARTDEQAAHYLQNYERAIDAAAGNDKTGDAFKRDGISVKLSALHPRYQLIKRERLARELLPQLKALTLRARAANIMITIDAEEANRLDIALSLFTALCEDKELADWNGLGIVVQAYHKRATAVIHQLTALANKTGRIIPLRLVKGAYWDAEIKSAQVMGLANYPVFTRKEHTDISYLACAKILLEHGREFYPQFATHNARTAASVLAMAKRLGNGNFEFQRLYGMGEMLHRQLLEHAPSRVYAPVGEHKDLLAYLIRRLLENGANSSFVHVLMDENIPLPQLLADPIAVAGAHGFSANKSIPLPDHIYGAWKNSRGFDLGYESHQQQISADLHFRDTNLPPTLQAEPIAAELAMQQALAGYSAWAKTSVEMRASILERAADEIENHRAGFLQLLTQEAGKTLGDAIAEIREAADFCRYYAMLARREFTPKLLPGPTGESNVLSLHPRGVFVCISPWNFPLAIFIGQVVGALVSGNAVIAKPAEQTPRIAKLATQLLHAAGMPKHVLQCVCGDGATVGAALVAQPDIAGVVFTGSVEVAQIIQRTLAARKGAIVPLIAETGGQNCMVVDSSALLETAVDDIILSAFGSAGQRCSALRVLLVQDDIAEKLIGLLTGAMQELQVGIPSEFATDIGPLIDAEAKGNIDVHIARMTKEAKLLATAPAPKDAGHFVAPHLFEIHSLDQLTGEVFGPVLHLLRFKGKELPELPARINAMGYGLTFGIHSRIEAHIQLLAGQVKCGNCYVNRSMIGATVGVQPFGGEGLSGTGPKVGGLHSLTRFTTERVVSTNIAAIGGNIALLAKK